MRSGDVAAEALIREVGSLLLFENTGLLEHATYHLSSMSCSMILSLPLISSPPPSNHARDNRCPGVRRERWPLWIRQHLAGCIHRHFLVPRICVLPSFLRVESWCSRGFVDGYRLFLSRSSSTLASRILISTAETISDRHICHWWSYTPTVFIALRFQALQFQP